MIHKPRQILKKETQLHSGQKSTQLVPTKKSILVSGFSRSCPGSSHSLLLPWESQNSCHARLQFTVPGCRTPDWLTAATHGDSILGIARIKGYGSNHCHTSLILAIPNCGPSPDQPVITARAGLRTGQAMMVRMKEISG
jgi:hypothetical protein